MARPLVFEFHGSEIPCAFQKVERADVYGYVEIETFDDQERPCTLATVAQDGKTLAGPGDTALGCVTPDGTWVERASLQPVTLDGERLEPAPSSFSAPIALGAPVTVEQLLDHTIRAVYHLAGLEATAPSEAPPELGAGGANEAPPELGAGGAALLQELLSGTIYSFPFSYRGGINPDTAFLIAGDGHPFMLVGSPTRLEFVGLPQTAPAVDEDEPATEEDDLDFSMF